MSHRQSRRGFLIGMSGAIGAALTQHGVGRASPGSSFSFFVIGDWGVAGSKNALRVAEQMQSEALSRSPRFVISVGDNFYSDGVNGIDDPLWQEAFEGVFSGPGLRCPWYVVLGNHDRRGSVDAQIAYSRVDPRWHLPSPFYSRVEALQNAATVEFFFLDTVPLVQESVLDRVSGLGAVREQLAWLEASLTKSIATWKIVVGHHPVFSGGSHGTSEHLVRALKPILDRHRVSLYLSGHDHSLQDIAVDGVRYLTSGAGAKLGAVQPIAGTLFAASELGFLEVSASPHAIDFAFRGANGLILHAAGIAPRDVARVRTSGE